MTKDEIKEIHSKHKRDADLAAEVKRKSDFEVNMEDEDDDFDQYEEQNAGDDEDEEEDFD
jgi:hypothetical protein